MKPKAFIDACVKAYEENFNKSRTVYRTKGHNVLQLDVDYAVIRQYVEATNKIFHERFEQAFAEAMSIYEMDTIFWSEEQYKGTLDEIEHYVSGKIDKSSMGWDDLPLLIQNVYHAKMEGVEARVPTSEWLREHDVFVEVITENIKTAIKWGITHNFGSNCPIKDDQWFHEDTCSFDYAMQYIVECGLEQYAGELLFDYPLQRIQELLENFEGEYTCSDDFLEHYAEGRNLTREELIDAAQEEFVFLGVGKHTIIACKRTQ